jgi:segregation and condensation protein A
MWGAVVTYQVELDAYSGPLDLLLYLVHEEEVDIYDIPIAVILEKYLEHIEAARRLDIDLAAEFLVMASTLMEIKSRMLLPVEDRPPEEEEEDPRAELVRQLLAYRAFKEAAGRLADLRELRSRRLRRGMPVRLPDEEGPGPEPPREASLFDLADSYARLMRQTMGSGPRTILFDEVSMEERIEAILAALEARDEFSLRALVSDASNRAEVAGTFFALLELVRQREVVVLQDSEFGEITVRRHAGEDGAALPAPCPELEPYLPPPVERRSEPGPGGRPRRAPRRAHFRGIDLPEEEEADLGETDGAEARLNRRIDEILRRADEIAERFEASRAGRMRDGKGSASADLDEASADLDREVGQGEGQPRPGPDGDEGLAPEAPRPAADRDDPRADSGEDG